MRRKIVGPIGFFLQDAAHKVVDQFVFALMPGAEVEFLNGIFILGFLK
jgi:hypothetical protein